MNPILAGIALAVVAGTVVAVASRGARMTMLGLVVVLIGSAVLAGAVGEVARSRGLRRDRGRRPLPGAQQPDERMAEPPRELPTTVGPSRVCHDRHRTAAPRRAAGRRCNT